RNKRYAAILSVVTVLALALSLVAVPVPSFAAAPTVKTSAFSDVAADSAQAPAFNALAAIGVYTGYPDGTAHPSQTITRAEAAAVAVRLAGREASATALANQTPTFKDNVPSWAWGYVNVATSLGIIKGYPDGTFRANNPVTQAEMVAMITRVLGNDKGVTGTWPTNYMVYADQAGLLSGVNPAATVPATRAEVAQMAYNALSVSAKYDAATGAFDRDYAGAPLATLDSQGNPVQNSNPTTYGEAMHFVVQITLTPSTALASTVYVSGAASLQGLYNTTVLAYKPATASAYAAIEPASTGVTTVSGKFSSWDGSVLTITDADGNNIQYPVSNSVTVQINGGTSYSGTEKVNQLTYASQNVTVNVTLTLDANGTVTAINGLAWNATGDLQDVTASATASGISTLKVAGSAYSAPAAAQLFLDGNPATASDLSKLLTAWNVSGLSPQAKIATKWSGSYTGTVYIANVYSKTIAGKVTSLTSDGTNYYVNLDVNGQTVKVTYDWKTAGWNSVGQTVTFIVDTSNNGLAVTTTSTTGAEQVQIATFNSYTESIDSTGTHYIASVTLADGTQKSITVADETYSLSTIQNAKAGDVLVLADGVNTSGTVVRSPDRLQANPIDYVAALVNGDGKAQQTSFVTLAAVTGGFVVIHQEYTVSTTTYFNDTYYLTSPNLFVWGKNSNSTVKKLADVQPGDHLGVYLFKGVVFGIQDLDR
ncbi:MAG: S-layer homology domain-containing protein, partial [Firmicutes bacterium]|nr:S-layer homology domain-containing protein [Bacillota bacterium]